MTKVKVLIKQIEVNLGARSYWIHVENGLLNHCGKIIAKDVPSKKIVILTVRRIFHKYGRSLEKSLRKEKVKFTTIIIPDGEKQKTERTLFLILKKMANYGLHRDSALLSFGGGVVGDLGGMAASIYMRGIKYLQLPTTLLAQVDASIGGKTAIDFAGIKNLVGTFYQPEIVLIDPFVLKSLNNRQFTSGLAEIIKYGIIKDEYLFGKIEKETQNILNKDTKILNLIICRSCEIKAKIVSEDENERGKRIWLNYGHTLGHALESYFKYRILTHGEAIAYGMYFAAKLSQRLNICSEETVLRQKKLLQKVGLFRKIPRFDIQKIYKKMILDKKSNSGQVQFILTRKIGLVTIQKNIPKSIILSALEQFQTDANGLY